MIRLENISKSFKGADGEVRALCDIDLTIDDGEIFGIIGPSGAGKSTLLRCINLLERPDSGKVIVDGTDMMSLDRRQLREFRGNIGVVFQQFNLLPQKTVEANVRYPLDIAGIGKSDAENRVAELLELVGIAAKAHEYPSRLSGGQQQRVAIARALSTNPRIVLCDECTSALDPMTTESILSLLRRLNDSFGITMVLVTHDMGVVETACDKTALLEEGVLVSVEDVARKDAIV